MHHSRCSIFILLLLGCGAKADSFCFAFAETYYEQVYCQLQAKAQIKNLPPFYQFKKNNEPVQYSLLKRPAERNAIKLAPPAKTVAATPLVREVGVTSSAINEPDVVHPRNIKSNSLPSAQAQSSCRVVGRQIHCAGSVYELLGNKANHRLSAQALDTQNTMALPKVGIGAASLISAYEKYIAKMCEIGLCGVTMTYAKFSYLYQDLQSKGLDFTQRFEIMFGFLKKDKAAMAVSESISIPAALSMDDCSELGSRYFICDHERRNYIFQLN